MKPTPFHSNILTIGFGSRDCQLSLHNRSTSWTQVILCFLSSGSSAQLFFGTSQSILEIPKDVSLFCVCKDVRWALCYVSMHSMDQRWTWKTLSIQNFAVRFVWTRQTPTAALFRDEKVREITGIANDGIRQFMEGPSPAILLVEATLGIRFLLIFKNFCVE